MYWPNAADYNEAIQNLATTVQDAELRGGEPELRMGVPVPYSGGLADVYKVHCPATGNTWAVKCFTRQVKDLQDRYRVISDCLKQIRLSFMVDFEYLEQEILIRGNRYPILKMCWVEGQRLNTFVEVSLDQPQMLNQLAELWVRLAARLDEAKLAHGDLQHGNVLLVPIQETGQLRLKLIDYDGMFVPDLAGKPPGERGLASFQHPGRDSTQVYCQEVDRFSHLLIYTATKCLATAAGRELWGKYDTRQNLLFKESDFKQPSQSTLFHELWHQWAPGLRDLVGHLLLASQGPLTSVPRLSELITDGKVRPLLRDETRRALALLGTGPVVLQRDSAAGKALSSDAWLAAGDDLIALDINGDVVAIDIVEAELVDQITAPQQDIWPPTWEPVARAVDAEKFAPALPAKPPIVRAPLAQRQLTPKTNRPRLTPQSGLKDESLAEWISHCEELTRLARIADLRRRGAIGAAALGIGLIALASRHISYVSYSPDSYITWSSGPMEAARELGGGLGAIAGIILPSMYVTKATPQDQAAAGCVLIPLGILIFSAIGMFIGMLIAIGIISTLPLALGVALGAAGGALLVIAAWPNSARKKIIDGCWFGAIVGVSLTAFAWATSNSFLANMLFATVFGWVGYAGGEGVTTFGLAVVKAVRQIDTMLLTAVGKQNTILHQFARWLTATLAVLIVIAALARIFQYTFSAAPPGAENSAQSATNHHG